MRKDKLNLDVQLLIKSIEDRPCLWDRRLECYKDRAERREAWLEIYNILYTNYDELSSGEQRHLGDAIQAKWANIRDAFVKAMKKNSSKKYTLYDNLKFLLDFVPASHENQDNSAEYITYLHDEDPIETEETLIEDTKLEHEVFIYPASGAQSDEDVTFIQQPTKRRKIRKERYIKAESPNSLHLEYNSDIIPMDDNRRIMNEDEAFFASLLPSVVKYSEEERLEFRIEVLAVMKRINDKRNMDSDTTI